MSESLLIRCDLCGNLFNPGGLEEDYPFGFFAVCDDCLEKESFNF